MIGMIKQARKQKGLTIRQLSRMVRMPPSFLSEIENGNRSLPDQDDTRTHDFLYVLGLQWEDVKQENDKNTLKRKLKALEKSFGRDLFMLVLQEYDGKTY